MLSAQLISFVERNWVYALVQLEEADAKLRLQEIAERKLAQGTIYRHSASLVPQCLKFDG